MSNINPIPSIRLNHAGRVNCPEGSSHGPRTLSDFELVFVEEGNVQLSLGKKAISGGPGSLFLTRPGMTDLWAWIGPGRVVHAYAHFSLSKIPPSWPKLEAWPLQRSLNDKAMVSGLFRTLIGCNTLKASQSLAAPALFFLIEGMLKGFPSGQEDSSWAPEIERALALMRRRLGDEAYGAPSLDELARAAAVSPGHLCRLFKRQFSLGPMELQRRLRLSAAAALLGRSNLSIKQVAAQSAFADEFHFSKAFKSYFGVTPKAWRGGERAPSAPSAGALAELGIGGFAG